MKEPGDGRGRKAVLALLRGDHSLSETKFATDGCGRQEVRAAANPEEIRQWFRSRSGLARSSRHQANMRVIADKR